jgi:hypothetical protein
VQIQKVCLTFLFSRPGPPNLVHGSVLTSSVIVPSRSHLRRSNRGLSYQTQRQSPLEQLTIGESMLNFDTRNLINQIFLEQ